MLEIPFKFHKGIHFDTIDDLSDKNFLFIFVGIHDKGK